MALPRKPRSTGFQVDHGDKAKIRHHVVNGYLSGDTGGFFNLPGGPIGFALGAEYRKESSSTIPDQVTQDGLLADYSTTNTEIGDYNVKEVFGEINLPILSKVPGADTLSVGGPAVVGLFDRRVDQDLEHQRCLRTGARLLVPRHLFAGGSRSERQ